MFPSLETLHFTLCQSMGDAVPLLLEGEKICDLTFFYIQIGNQTPYFQPTLTLTSKGRRYCQISWGFCDSDYFLTSFTADLESSFSVLLSFFYSSLCFPAFISLLQSVLQFCLLLWVYAIQKLFQWCLVGGSRSDSVYPQI